MGATGCDFLCLVFLTVQLPLRDPFLKTALCSSAQCGPTPSKTQSCRSSVCGETLYVCMALNFQGHCTGRIWLEDLVKISTVWGRVGHEPSQKQPTHLTSFVFFFFFFLAQIINSTYGKNIFFLQIGFKAKRPRRGKVWESSTLFEECILSSLTYFKDKQRKVRNAVDLRTRWSLSVQSTKPQNLMPQ